MKDNKNILIIDDDENICRTLTFVLEKKGYVVDIAHSGHEALNKSRGISFNVVLLDIKLPDITGVDLLVDLKKEHPEMDVMMITGYGSLEAAVSALNEGASAFFTKPLNLDEVLNTVNNALERQRLVAEKLEAEQKLKESEQQYRDAYETAIFYKDLITHDLTNILQNIQSSTDLLSITQAKHGKREEITGMLDIMQEQIERGARLVENSRKFAEIEETEVRIETVDTSLILKDSIDYHAKSFPDRTINVRFDPPGRSLLVRANDLLTDVIDNILLNAIVYNDNPAVEIAIKLSREYTDETSYIKLEIIDNASGVPDSMKEQVFQRVSWKAKGVGGMGLGLSLVKKIIDSYNGKIWIKNRIADDHAKGSNFTVLIPEVI